MDGGEEDNDMMACLSRSLMWWIVPIIPVIAAVLTVVDSAGGCLAMFASQLRQGQRGCFTRLTRDPIVGRLGGWETCLG